MDSRDTKALLETPLSAIIKQKISVSKDIGILADGDKLSAIPFHQYMTLCLYHPEFGYYLAGASRVGRDGDFYTSAYVGELMGEQLADELSRLTEQWFADAERVEVIDWGGGTGRLSRQMLDTWNKGSHTHGCSSHCGDKFTLTIVEGDPEHRRLANEQLEAYIQAGKAKVVGSEEEDSLASGMHPIIIVANELLDAFPTHRLVQRDGRLWEWGVAWEEGKRSFIPCLIEPGNPRLNQWMNEQGITVADNQSFEINLDAADWTARVANRLKRAIIVFIDYGDVTEEIIAPHRMDGTLLCYHQHRAHNDPFVMPGEQDITSHVNFEHIRQSLEALGWRELWYGSQKQFLVESGILEKLISHTHSDPFHPVVRRNRAIRQLLLSDGMSELFKVQIFINSHYE